MPEITIDFSVYCSGCGAGLCSVTDVKGNVVTVDLCSKCLSIAKDEGHEEGHREGYKEAQEKYT